MGHFKPQNKKNMKGYLILGSGFVMLAVSAIACFSIPLLSGTGNLMDDPALFLVETSICLLPPLLIGITLLIIGLFILIRKQPKSIDFMKAQKDVQGLIHTLGNHKEGQGRRAAAEALGQLGDAEAVEPLIVALQNQECPVRQAAAKALGEIGDPRAVEPLITMLEDKEWSVCKTAATSLGQIGDARAVDSLIVVLKHKDKIVRTAAAQSLARIGPAAVTPFMAALQDNDPNIRKDSAEVLGLIGDPLAIDPLIKALKDDDRGVCEMATLALGQIGNASAVAPLIATLEGNVNLASVRALGQLGDNRAVVPLISLLQSSDWKKRLAAAEALVSLYRSGRLDVKDKQLILAKRILMTSPHEDHHSTSSSDCNRGGRHIDRGTGASFPM